MTMNDRKRALAKTALKVLQHQRDRTVHANALYDYSVVLSRAIEAMAWSQIQQTLYEVADGKFQLNLLYVEDDEALATTMIEWFRGRHCTVKHVTSANKAVSLLRAKNADFDAVITDWHLIGNEKGGVVAEEAKVRRIPVRIYSGASSVRPWGPIWIDKGWTQNLHDFLHELRT